MSSGTSEPPVRRPSHPPPDHPLPPLPRPKTRSPLPDTPDSLGSRGSRRGSPASSLPTPTVSRIATPPSLSQLRTTGAYTPSSIPTVSTIESSPPRPSPAGTPSGRVVSIGSFPQPPKGTLRRPSQSPSPLSTPTLSTSEFAPALARDDPRSRRLSPQPARPGAGGSRRPSRKSSGYGQPSRNVSLPSTSPSLLDGRGQSGVISSALGAPGSEHLLTIPSPLQTRPSSANGSTLTESTNFEDVDEEPISRGRLKDDDTPIRGKSADPKENKGNVVVSVRVRPDAGGGDVSGASVEWMVDGRRSLISYKGGEGGEYCYDNVFSQHDHNSRVYDSAAKRLVRRVMEGYHGTVFAYGMTGTGKTFSMQGTATSPGVIPLAITDIFSYIRENPNREFLLRVSYLEIYNEKIYDLLSPNAGGVGAPQQEEIKLREDSKRGVYASPLKEEIVQSPTQLLRVIARGDLARRTGSTQYNARSSRSHAVVQIVVESRERVPATISDLRVEGQMPSGGVMVSSLSLIDLAGSEKAADNKERRTEGAHINKSLLTLGTVIARLSGDKDDGSARGKDARHLPYRDSKLTRLLQPALSGNSLVSILCTVQLSDPSSGNLASANAHIGETLNTLNFASRAKNNIVSHAKRNETDPAQGDSGSRALLDRYRMEIEGLRRQLELQNRSKKEAERSEEEEERWREREQESVDRHEGQLLEMQLARTALKERIGHLNRLILSSRSIGVNKNRLSAGSSGMRRGSALSVKDTTVARRSHTEGARRSSAGTSEQISANSASPPYQRSISVGSTTMGMLPAAPVSQMAFSEGDDTDEDEEVAAPGLNSDGNASALEQIRALQDDLADKNRYIATLEKRLLQARRSSHNRAGTTFRKGSSGEADKEKLLREKVGEIEELRARLDDQIRMVTALRSAARKRDVLENGGGRASIVRGHEAPETPTAVSKAPSNGVRQIRRAASSITNHTRNLSNSSSGANINFSRLTPMALLSPTQQGEGNDRGRDTGASKSIRRKESVEEMTRMLDEMISQKVEGGYVGGAPRSTGGGLVEHARLPVPLGTGFEGEPF